MSARPPRVVLVVKQTRNVSVLALLAGHPEVAGPRVKYDLFHIHKNFNAPKNMSNLTLNDCGGVPMEMTPKYWASK